MKKNQKKNPTEKQVMKRKLRGSAEWKSLRKKVAETQYDIDPITARKLTRGFNLHHLSQDDDFYDNLEMERFVALNSQSHDTVHFLYNIVKREGNFDVLERIKDIISRMIDITEKDCQAWQEEKFQ